MYLHLFLLGNVGADAKHRAWRAIVVSNEGNARVHDYLTSIFRAMFDLAMKFAGRNELCEQLFALVGDSKNQFPQWPSDRFNRAPAIDPLGAAVPNRDQ